MNGKRTIEKPRKRREAKFNQVADAEADHDVSTAFSDMYYGDTRHFVRGTGPDSLAHAIVVG